MAGKRTLPDYQCRACGMAFRPLRAASRYCSRPCARTVNGGQNRKDETWWVNGRGYVEGRIWVDGVQRRVKKHRQIVEAALGRPLLSSEDVHHRDGNKLNNDLSNLDVVPHGEHSRITNAGRSYGRGYRMALSDEERTRRSQRMRELHASGRIQKPRAALAKAEG